MKHDESPVPDPSNGSLSRRRLAQILAATGAVVVLDQILPIRWSAPSITVGVLPDALALSGTTSSGTSTGTGGPAEPDQDAFQDIDPTHGDNRVDIISSQAFVDPNGDVWIRVEFAGPWPPSGLYSWYAKIYLLGPTGSTELASFLVEEHNMAPKQETMGAGVTGHTLVMEPDGFRVRFHGPVTPSRYAIESGVLKTEMGSMFVQDTAGPFTFTPTEEAFPP